MFEGFVLRCLLNYIAYKISLYLMLKKGSIELVDCLIEILFCSLELIFDVFSLCYLSLESDKVHKFDSLAATRHFLVYFTPLSKTLYKAYCQVFYTCRLWTSFTQKAISIFRVQYHNGCRMLMGLPRTCSASGMFAQARTDDFYTIVCKKTALMLYRLRVTPNSILMTQQGMTRQARPTLPSC